jgi:probable phosphoglycerate mutase
VRRLVLGRHGETDGASSVRFYGATDVDLCDEGRAQMRRLAADLRTEPADLVMASPLRRSWRSAWILSGGAPVRLENDFREVDFGRWEGLTRDEIHARDPILFEDWQARAESFEYPGGESRKAFRERVLRGLERLLASEAQEPLVVVHKGVVRTIVEALTGETTSPDEPAVGSAIGLTRDPSGRWYRGRRSSNPPGLDA